MDSGSSSKVWRIFSYGSNSITQLRARVKNPSLESVGAKCMDFSRVFCYQSSRWGGGGVASICPCEGGVVFGACVSLSEEEKQRLDTYEGGYRLEQIEVVIDGETVESFAYIAGHNPSTHGFTLQMDVRPSEEYLTAIHVMLREKWNMDGETVTIRSFNGEDGTVSVEGEWSHPGRANLSLEALCVEINTFKANPWIMPANIEQTVNILKSVIPLNDHNDESSKSKCFAHQLIPYLEQTKSLIDDDSYQALNLCLA